MPTLGALKAEVIFGLYLIHRHRAVRLAGVLALIALVALGGKSFDGTPLDIVLAGVLGAVGGSRILAPGPALNSVGPEMAVGWVVLARIFAAGVLIVPIGTLMNLALAQGESGFLQAVPVVGYGLIVVASVASLAPWIGASGAGTVGVFMAWVGRTPPWDLFNGVQSGFVEALVSLLWVVAPMSWRMGTVMGKGSGAAALAGTLVLGVTAAVISVRLRLTRRFDLV